MKEPETYANSNCDSIQHTTSILKSFKDILRFNENETILDVGCGPGNQTIKVLKNFIPTKCNIVGGDISQEMIDYANKTYGTDDVIFKTMDIQDGHLFNVWEKECFDKIFSFYCLHNVPDQRKAMSNIYSLLRQGGEILLVMPGKSPMSTLMELISKNPEFTPHIKNPNTITPIIHSSNNPEKDLKVILDLESFQNVLCELRPVSFVYPSLESYLELFRLVKPFIQEMPFSVQEKLFQFCSSVIKEKKIIELNNGKATVKEELLVAYAKKKL